MTGLAILFLSFIFSLLWIKYFEKIKLKYIFFYLLILSIFFFKPLFLKEYFQIPSYGNYAKNLYPFASKNYGKINSNTLLIDVTTQFYPWQIFSLSELKSFRFPLYNPYSGCGLPFLENAQSSIYSFHSFISLFFPELKILTVASFFQLFFCLIFMNSFLLQLKLSPFSCFLGSITFAFCTYNIAWLYFPHVKVVPYFVLTLFLIEKMLKDKAKKYKILLSISISQIILSGHPESGFFFLIISFLYALRIFLISKDKNFFYSFLLFSATGFLISSFFILPFFNYLPYSLRYNELKISKLYKPVSFLEGVKEINGLINPLFYGIPTIKSFNSPANFNELASYCGIFALFFSLFSYKNRKGKPFLFFTLILITVFLIISNFPGTYWLIDKIPLLNLTAYKRLRFLISFSLCVLAAIGFDYIFERKKRVTYYALFFLIFISFLMGFSDALKDENNKLKFLFCTGIICFLIYIFLERFNIINPSILILLVLIDLILPLWNYNEVNKKEIEMKETEGIKFLKQNINDHRFVACGVHFMPNLSSIFKLEDVRDNDPMAFFDYRFFLYKLNLIKIGYWISWINLNSSALDFLSIKYILYEPWRRDYAEKPVYIGKDMIIIENKDVKEKFFVPKKVIFLESKKDIWEKIKEVDLGKVSIFLGNGGERENTGEIKKIEKISPLKYKIFTSSKEKFFISTSFLNLKHWKVYNNKKPLKKFEINGAFFGFEAPEGENIIEVKYYNGHFITGALISLFSFFFILVYLKLK